jgi:hypothetical protein
VRHEMPLPDGVPGFIMPRMVSKDPVRQVPVNPLPICTDRFGSLCGGFQGQSSRDDVLCEQYSWTLQLTVRFRVQFNIKR